MKKIASTELLFPIVLTALAAIVMLVAGGAMWIIRSNSNMVEQHQLRDGNLIAEGLANAVAPDLVRRDYGALEGRLLQTASDPNVRSALVINVQGQVLGYVYGSSRDAPAHPVFDFQKVLPPQAKHIQEEVNPDFMSIWHIVNVGMDVGWVRVDIANTYYAESLVKIKQEVWGLALFVMAAGFFLLGVAIFRSRKLLHLHDREIENQQHILEDKAYYDALTHLPNRSLLFDRLNQAIAHNARYQRVLAVCFVDLDNFKPINDTYGHDAGDQVLIEVARRFQAAVRGDDTVARLGGDEFIVLLGDMNNAQEAALAVDRLLLSLFEPLIIKEKQINMLASIGYALYPEDSKDSVGLLYLSDQTMYQAKAAGGNCIRRYQPPSDTSL